MKEELIALGKVLQCDFEDLVNQQVAGWLTNDFLMNADLQPLTELEAALSAFWEINDQFALLETSLTSGFIPGESSEELGTSETGLREGFPERDCGLGTGIFTQQGVRPNTANRSQQFEVKNQTQAEKRSPSQLPELTSVSESPTVKNQTQAEKRSPLGLPELTNVSESPTVKNQTQAEKRSPSQLPELTNVSKSLTVKNQTQAEKRSPSQLPELTNVSESPTVKNQTQAEKRSPLGLKELAAIVDSSRSITNDEEVKNQTQAEKRSPLGLKELANFLASEPYSNDSDSVNSQAAPAIDTASTTAFSSQDSGYWEGIEAQNRVVRSNLIPKSIIEADDSNFESDRVVGYPASSQIVQHLKPFTSQQISKGYVLSESSFSQEQHQENYSQENPTTKHETNFFSQPLDQEIEIDLIIQAIAQEINREYRRFYGC